MFAGWFVFFFFFPKRKVLVWLFQIIWLTQPLIFTLTVDDCKKMRRLLIPATEFIVRGFFLRGEKFSKW